MTPGPLRRLRPWLGTYVAVEACLDDAAAAPPAIEDAYAEIAAIHAALSFHAADSELSRLNREAHRQPTPVGPHTWSVLTAAVQLAAASDGVFDPTVAPQLVHHGALPRPHGPDADAHASWRDVELLDDHRVRFHRPLWIDLGGIAKGYAVDCAIDTLLRQGARHAVVNAGGDLRVAGPQAHGLPLTLRDPADPARHIPLGTLGSGAVATSGEFLLGRPPGGEALSPLVDPRHGPRHARPGSVTVIADQCMLADGLTKIVALLGTASLPLLESLHAHAAILEAPDQLHITAGFRNALGHPRPPGTTPHA